MTTLDIKQVEPLIKELSLPEEVKKAFYQTFFGSLMGQAFLFMGLLAIYFAIVAVLYTYAKTPLQVFRDDFGLFFWAILAAPLACILLFQVLPTALRALRERRLKAMVIGGVRKPGYFRLQPYGPPIRTCSSGSTASTARFSIGSPPPSRRCSICPALRVSASLRSWRPAYWWSCAMRAGAWPRAG